MAAAFSSVLVEEALAILSTFEEGSIKKKGHGPQKPFLLRMVATVEGGDAATDASSLCCPITCGPIRESTTTACGHTFERAAIETWIASGRGTCPMCRSKIAHERPNAVEYDWRSPLFLEGSPLFLEGGDASSDTSTYIVRPPVRVVIRMNNQ